MADARLYLERALSYTLEKDFSDEVTLVSPDGVDDTVFGQVLWCSVRENPATGAQVVLGQPVATVRLSSLQRIPKKGEKWSVWIPRSNTDDTPVLHILEKPFIEDSIGFMRLHLNLPKQSTV